MLKTKIIWTLLLLPLGASAEFFVWYDESGVKHVSTHSKECIDFDRKVIKHECGYGQEYSANTNPAITDIYQNRTSIVTSADNKKTISNYFSNLGLEDCDKYESLYKPIKGGGEIGGMFTVALGIRGQKQKTACLRRNRETISLYLEQQRVNLEAQKIEILESYIENMEAKIEAQEQEIKNLGGEIQDVGGKIDDLKHEVKKTKK